MRLLLPIHASVVTAALLCTPVIADEQSAADEGFTDADYAAALATVEKLKPSDAFTAVLEKPFVVVGDEKPEMVMRRAERTVGWAVRRLRESYFTRDPDAIITIWLFKDKTSYEAHCKKLFNVKPHTPFGFYSPANKALIMNIATGGGTLVHEIVHPFVASNFPNCPAWFNEGLGTLYEQCGDRDGRIVGFPNWRLSGLQRAIKQDTVPSFKTLCATTTHEFYRKDPGTNYAQTRYLCYYLQERGKLREFYARFRDDVDNDPTGYATLTEVLGEDDMVAFQKRWAKWVMRLKPGR